MPSPKSSSSNSSPSPSATLLFRTEVGSDEVGDDVAEGTIPRPAGVSGAVAGRRHQIGDDVEQRSVFCIDAAVRWRHQIAGGPPVVAVTSATDVTYGSYAERGDQELAAPAFSPVHRRQFSTILKSLRRFAVRATCAC